MSLKHARGSSFTVPDIPDTFEWKWNFLDSFEKYSNTKSREIILEPNFPCGPTDGQTIYWQTWRSYSSLWQFCERAYRRTLSICKWMWTAGGYGLQVELDCKWVWTASGCELQVGMGCIHITQNRNQYWAPLKEAMQTAVMKPWQNNSNSKISEWYTRNLTMLAYRCIPVIWLCCPTAVFL